MKQFPEQHRGHLQLLLKLLRIRNLYESLPLLVVMVPFVVGVLPNRVERALSISLGAFSITIFEVFCILTLPFLLMRRHTCVPLLLLSLAMLLLGGFSALYANIPTAAFGLAILISWVFLAASKIAWTRNDVYYLTIGSTVILFLLLLQLIYFGLGFGSYYATSTASTVGIVGETSRVRTTYGPATGTSVAIYILTVLSVFGAYFYTRQVKWSVIFLGIGIASILLTFARGGMLMIFMFAVLLFIFRSRQIRLRFGGRIVILMVGVGVLYAAFFSRQDLVHLLIHRGGYATTFLHDNSRIMRYKEAFDYAKERPFGGGLHNYYFRSGWLAGRPGIAEGRTSPHNVYLIFFAELGLPGLAMILIFNFMLLIAALRRRNYYFLMAILPIILVGQNIELIYYEAPYIYLWAILASLVMTLRNDELPGWSPPLPPNMRGYPNSRGQRPPHLMPPMQRPPHLMPPMQRPPFRPH